MTDRKMMIDNAIKDKEKISDLKKIAIYIIIPNILKEELLSRMCKHDFKCTLLSTTGAYLRTGQTSILTITEEKHLAKLKEIIEKTKMYHNENYNEKVKNILIFSVPVIDFEIV